MINVPTLTDLLSEGRTDDSDLANMFNLSKDEIKEIRRRHDKLVASDNVTDAEYLSWCAEIDKAYLYNL